MKWNTLQKMTMNIHHGKIVMTILTMNYSVQRRACLMRMLPFLLGAFMIGLLIQMGYLASFPISPSKKGRSSLPHINKRKSYPDNSNNLQIATQTIQKERLWLQSKLFDLNFTWILNNERICEKRDDDPDDLRLLPVLVHTARSHFEERLVLRNSWGSLPLYKKWGLRFVFLLGDGKPPEGNFEREKALEEEKRKLAQEQSEFGDVVIGNFIDTYHNLTYKHMMGYKWVLNYCSNATTVMKIDDDVFINIKQWLDWLSEGIESANDATNEMKNVPDIYCRIWGSSPPFRTRNNKWYVSYKEWQPHYYPPFCSGWAYTLPIGLIQKIYSVSEDIKFNWIDDVFVTGQLMQLVKAKFNLKIVIGNLSKDVTYNPKDYKAMCENRPGWGSGIRRFRVITKVERGEFFERDMMCLWNKTRQGTMNR